MFAVFFIPQKKKKKKHKICPPILQTDAKNFEGK